MKILGDVDRVSGLTAGSFEDRYFSQRPVVITDAMDGWKATSWTIEQFSDHFKHAKLPVRMDDDEFSAFCEGTNDPALRDSKEDRRIVFRGISFWVIKLDAYFKAVVRGGAVAQRLPYVMDVPMSRSIIESYLRALKIEAMEDWNPLITALETMTTEVTLPPYLIGAKDFRFWFTPRPRPRGNIHADAYHNLNAQIQGRKEWVLLAPDQSNRLEGITGSPKMSRQTVEKSDTVPDQEVLEAEAYSCTTDEGELLYIPKLWWHAATALDLCINVNAWHTSA
jgi:lysine-specific demethylase 8